MLTFLIVYSTMAIGLVSSQYQAPNPNVGRLFVCPQPNGTFEDPTNCSRYYQCDRGFPTLQNCLPQMFFNPATGVCDWPHEIQNQRCLDSPSALPPQLSSVCRNNPGNLKESFLAAHPTICNAYFMCSLGVLHFVCSFCAPGTYFNTELHGCYDYQQQGLDINVICQGKEFVQHRDMVLRRGTPDCWPFMPPALAQLFDLIRGRGGYPGSSYPGSSYPGSSYPGSSYPGSSYPGSSYPGSSYPGSSYPGSSYPGSYPNTRLG